MGLEFARFDCHRQPFLIVHREQRNASDLFEVHPDRIVERKPRRQSICRVVVAAVLGRLLILLLIDDLDAHRCDLFEELVDALGIDVFDVFENCVDFFIGQRSAFFPALH